MTEGIPKKLGDSHRIPSKEWLGAQAPQRVMMQQSVASRPTVSQILGNGTPPIKKIACILRSSEGKFQMKEGKEFQDRQRWQMVVNLP